MTTKNTNNQNPNTEPREKALEEAVRLAEKRLEVRRNSIAKIENKAVLLVTSCVVLIGYILSAEVDLTPKYCWQAASEIVRILSLIILTIATFCGGRVVNLGGVGVVGIDPDEINYKDLPLKTIYENTLDAYISGINKTRQTADKKIKKLKRAKLLLIWGFAFAIIWQILSFIEPFRIFSMSVICNICAA